MEKRCFIFLLMILCFSGPVFSQVEDCTNGIDDDGDGLVDCDDTECPAPILTLINDTSSCESFTLEVILGIDLTGSEAYYDNWPALGGSQISGTLTSSQTIYLLDGSGNCSDSLSFDVTIGTVPSLTLSDPPIICTPETHDLTDPMYVLASSGVISYFMDSTLNNYVQDATAAEDGEYYVQLNNDGCIEIGILNASVLPSPIAPIAGEDSLYCNGQFLTDLFAIDSEAGGLTWYSDYTLLEILGSGPKLSPFYELGVTPYYVTETGSNGCESEASVISLTIIECELIIPTAITPDGNLINDTWEVIDLDEVYPNNYVRIYNRWGMIIYEHSSDNGLTPYHENRWDGSYKGETVPTGSYYYVVQLNDMDENVLTGSISVIKE